MTEVGPRTRRVAFVGNVANSHFRAAQAIRGAGIDAHVYVNDRDTGASRPENDDPTLVDSPPHWIHRGNWITPASVLAPWRSPLARELSRYDVVVASGPGPVYSQFSGVPWCFLVTGGDLTVKPFPIAFWRWYPTWRHRLGELAAGAWQRRAVRRADVVWLQQFAPMVNAADRLGIPQSTRSERYFPMVVDTDRFAEDVVDASNDAWAAEVVGDADFVVFHPSRLVLDRSERMVRTGQWKGNEALLEGFAALVHDRGATTAALVIPDVAQSRDAGAVRLLMDRLGIADRVRWVSPPNGDLLSLPEMAALYRRADVVADEFGVGWFGFVTLEGLASGRPVLCHVDESVMARMYPSHPICNAKTAAEVGSQLELLRRDPELRRRRGSESREWVLEHHSAAAAAAVYVDAIEDLVSSG